MDNLSVSEPEKLTWEIYWAAEKVFKSDNYHTAR